MSLGERSAISLFGRIKKDNQLDFQLENNRSMQIIDTLFERTKG